jgi:ribosomal protein L11 methyltransferase
MAAPPQEWKAVLLNIPSRYEDELIGMISNRVLGIRVEPAGPDISSVEMYVGSDADVRALENWLDLALDRLGLEPGRNRPSVRSVPDGRWVENYQESLRPFTAGERFMIYPGEETPDSDGDRIPIILVPGRAFGTGEHATTRLALSALENAVATGSRWLDVGCGSGILSVAAARLGAADITALDIDRDSVDVCGEVAAVNGVTEAVHVMEGSLERIQTPCFDGVVANIHAPFFMEHAAGLHRVLQTGGALICSGFLEKDIPEISGALEDAGLAVRSCRQDGEWALILAEASP